MDTTNTTAEVKPLAASSAHAQDSPTTPQNVTTWGPHGRTGARRKATQKVFISHRAENQDFADRLRDTMTKNNLSASEIARRVWGTTKDKRGYTVARNRDRIGHYLNGTSFPDPENLARLAEAVGLTVEELAGERPTTARPRPRPQGSLSRQATVAAASGDLILTSLPAQPSKIRLQVDRVIHWRLAARIQELLKEAETGEVAEPDEQPQPGDVIQGGATATQ